MSSDLENTDEPKLTAADVDEQPLETELEDENLQSVENAPQEEDKDDQPTETQLAAEGGGVPKEVPAEGIQLNVDDDTEEELPVANNTLEEQPPVQEESPKSEDQEDQSPNVQSENEDQEGKDHIVADSTENSEETNVDIEEEITEITSETGAEEHEELPVEGSPRIADVSLHLNCIESEDEDHEDEDEEVPETDFEMENQEIEERLPVENGESNESANNVDTEEEIPEVNSETVIEDDELPLAGSPRIADVSLQINFIESEDEDQEDEDEEVSAAIVEQQNQEQEELLCVENGESHESVNEVFEEEPIDQVFDRDLEQQELPLEGRPRIASIDEKGQSNKMNLSYRTVNNIRGKLHCKRRTCQCFWSSVVIIVIIVLLATLLNPNTSDSSEVKAAEGPQSLSEPLCPSLYKTGGHNEHSPVIFEREQVVVCRTPQAGTKFLRDLTVSYVNSNIDTFPPDESMHAGFQHINPTLDKVTSVDDFHHYLFGDNAKRVMVVRHPVTRILAGFYEIASTQPDKFWKTLYGFDESHGSGPKAFEHWLKYSKFVTQDYHSDCVSNGSASMGVLDQSLHPQLQEWAPGQHCRCGINDCGVQWEIYKIEEVPVYNAIAGYLPSLQNMIVKKKLAKDNILETYTEDQFDANAYLTDEVLNILNPLTKEEQDFFGYEPYQSKKIYSL